ncbi:MAG: copper-binding protein [Phenylobacterium sp.]|nr:copper-binding protein [Phenylobacterium sp.]
MKRTTTTVAALGLASLLAACNPKPAETAAAPEAAPPTPAAAPVKDEMAGMKMAGDAKMAKGTGTVTAVSADSITINHGPIPEANWPAMTMGFKAAPEIAKQVKAGDKVAFDLKLEGGAGEVTAIRKP